MIGKVTGRLDHRGADHVLIDAGGVGYVVHCSERTLAAMPGPGERVALYTELLVREDLMQLFGFRTLAERECHRLLTSVQGVGAKASLAILGTLGTEGVARALSLGDAAAIRAAPGIGPKIAQRLVLELQAKAPSILAMGAAGAQPAMAGAGGAGCSPFEEHEPLHVECDVGHADLGLGARNADRPHAEPHPVLLLCKGMLDRRADLRAGCVGALMRRLQRFAWRTAEVDHRGQPGPCDVLLVFL